MSAALLVDVVVGGAAALLLAGLWCFVVAVSIVTIVGLEREIERLHRLLELSRK